MAVVGPVNRSFDVTIVTTHTAVVRGKYVHRALQRAACPAQYQHHPPDDGGAAWTVPARAAVEVAAAAESLGGTAHVTEWLVAS